MRKLVLWIVLGLPPLLLLHWDERHGAHVPKWLLLLWPRRRPSPLG